MGDPSTAAARLALLERQLKAAGCDWPRRDPPALGPEVPTFETTQDSEFIHFFKNVCIIGGLAAYGFPAAACDAI